MADETNQEAKPRPWWWPDTQGFLAVAIIGIVSLIVLILLLCKVQMTDTVQGVLMTLVGVLAAVLNDVYAYYFSSTSGSKAKDETIRKLAEDKQAAVEPPKSDATDPLTKWAK